MFSQLYAEEYREISRQIQRKLKRNIEKYRWQKVFDIAVAREARIQQPSSLCLAVKGPRVRAVSLPWSWVYSLVDTKLPSLSEHSHFL